ncbi:transcriptional regulatory [Fusarium sp. NRRL 52700]|nr:transcriptional regulatory [Fusarium sp. NRRL 52700]
MCDYSATSTSSESESIPAVISGSSALLPIARYSIPFKIPGSQKDRRLLHYFCVQGSEDISGFLASDFWSQTVLQAGHEDLVVRQALIAMSSLHLDYISSSPDRASVASPETLSLYGKALRSLGKRIGQPSDGTIRTALICCILFYCCESTIGDRSAALQHLSNGLKLLVSAQREKVAKESKGMESLTTIFERLDMQASFFEDDRIPILASPEYKFREPHHGLLLSRKSFFGLEDAQQQLVKLQAWLYHFVNKNVDFYQEPKESLSLDILEEKSSLEQSYNAWIEGINEFEKRDQHDDQTLHGIRTLLVHFHVCQMILQSKFPQDHGVFGVSPNPTAHHILDLAETLLKHTIQVNASPSATRTPRRNFSLETGVVAPLFALAIKCSDESVATRAAQMLAASYRREGLYDAQTMSRIIDELKRSRDSATHIKKENRDGTEAEIPLEYHIPEQYDGGGIDKLLWSMSLRDHSLGGPSSHGHPELDTRE